MGPDPYNEAGYDLTVLIPTFQEKDNIGKMISQIEEVLWSSSIHGEILTVDDQSSDGTIESVRRLQDTYSNIKLIVRSHDHGLSQSVTEGFSAAGSDLILVMDADFSHPPHLIPEFFLAAQKGSDIVIGSRYRKGGSIGHWPLKRRIISLGAIVLGRILIPPISDPVSGFFLVRTPVVRDAKLKPRGYKILLEILGKGTWDTFAEIPFVFQDREKGNSKLNRSIILDYVAQFGDILIFSMIHRNNAVWRYWETFFKFGFVGLSGIFVNTALLYFFTDMIGLFYLYSSVLAIEASILNNFLWNEVWTFSHEGDHLLSSLAARLLSFHLISFVGLVINVLILFVLTDMAGFYYLLSNLFGIFAAFLWNYWMNRNYTWKVQAA